MRGMPGSPVSNDEQILANVKACRLAITTRCHDFLKSTDSEVFLRGARAFTLQYPPIQRVEDVSERIEDLSDIPDADIERMKEIRAEELTLGGWDSGVRGDGGVRHVELADGPSAGSCVYVWPAACSARRKRYCQDVYPSVRGL